MKKKVFTILSCTVVAWSGVSAQKAFEHLSAGLEFFSTTGVGLEVATTLNPNFSLRGGISLFPYSYNFTASQPIDPDLMQRVNDALTDPDIRAALEEHGLPTTTAGLDTDPRLKATLGLVNGKILADIYPSKNSSFHFTAGLYIGSGKLLKAKNRMDQINGIFQVLDDNGYHYYNEIYVDDPEYQLSAKDLLTSNAYIKVNAVKPYIGLGIGRAVPKKRVGVSFDLGALYWGSPKITSDNANMQKMMDTEAGDVGDILKKFPIYPVMSLKINVKLF